MRPQRRAARLLVAVTCAKMAIPGSLVWLSRGTHAIIVVVLKLALRTRALLATSSSAEAPRAQVPVATKIHAALQHVLSTPVH
jgi:hypothetical protein